MVNVREPRQRRPDSTPTYEKSAREPVKILSWNIRSGGGARTQRIVHAILRHAPTVAVLTEYRPSGSAQLLAALAGEGFVHQALTTPNPRLGGVAILARHPLLVDEVTVRQTRKFSSRILLASLPAAGLSVCGFYGPIPGAVLSICWKKMLGVLARQVSGNVIVAGDFNTGLSYLDGPERRLLGSDYFAKLSTMGYVDLWRRARGDDAREHTWYGPLHGYRIDHAFASPTLVPRVRECWYSHDEREQGISDHSIMLVDLG